MSVALKVCSPSQLFLGLRSGFDWLPLGELSTLHLSFLSKPQAKGWNFSVRLEWPSLQKSPAATKNEDESNNWNGRSAQCFKVKPLENYYWLQPGRGCTRGKWKMIPKTSIYCGQWVLWAARKTRLATETQDCPESWHYCYVSPMFIIAVLYVMDMIKHLWAADFRSVRRKETMG